MDFRLTDEQTRFRDDLRAFLNSEVPLDKEEIFGVEPETDYPFAREISKKLAHKGWLTIGWPKEYGGGGKGQIEQAILSEEIGYRRVPRAGNTGIGIVGPALMKFGSREQKEKYIPPIARSEVEYCQGFSEPDAGSDLASLQLRAIKDGDYYILNGSKMFTSRAFYAEYIYFLARTDPEVPKHKGISLFIADLKTPGITLRPLPYINGHMASQTYFDDVRLHKNCLIGQENQGWYHAMTTLDYERAALERYGSVRRTFDDFLGFCKVTELRGKVLIDDPIVRYRIAQRRVGMEIWRLLCWKVAWMQSTGAVPNAEASVAFLYGTEERLRFAEMAMEILGPYGTLKHGNRWAPMLGSIEGIHREAMHLHGAGTCEIHRNIIALRGLGLPR